MAFFPTEKFEIETEMKLENAVHQLRRITESEEKSGWETVPFRGIISFSSFELTYKPFYRQPVINITGSFKETGKSLLIYVEMAYSLGTRIFIFTFTGVLFILFASHFIACFFENSEKIFFNVEEKSTARIRQPWLRGMQGSQSRRLSDCQEIQCKIDRIRRE